MNNGDNNNKNYRWNQQNFSKIVKGKYPKIINKFNKTNHNNEVPVYFLSAKKNISRIMSEQNDFFFFL